MTVTSAMSIMSVMSVMSACDSLALTLDIFSGGLQRKRKLFRQFKAKQESITYKITALSLYYERLSLNSITNPGIPALT